MPRFIRRTREVKGERAFSEMPQRQTPCPDMSQPLLDIIPLEKSVISLEFGHTCSCEMFAYSAPGTKVLSTPISTAFDLICKLLVDTGDPSAFSFLKHHIRKLASMILHLRKQRACQWDIYYRRSYDIRGLRWLNIIQDMNLSTPQ